MIDIALIREHPDWVKQQILKLQDPEAAARIGRIVELDKERRAILREAEILQYWRNALNKRMGGVRGDKTTTDVIKAGRFRKTAEALQTARQLQTYDAKENWLKVAGQRMAGARDEDIDDGNDNIQAAMELLTTELRHMGDDYDELQGQVSHIEAELNENMLWIPNLPHQTVPYGESDKDNKPWTMEGELREFDFEPKAHWDLGPALDIIDFERGVRMVGSRGYVLKGWGARMQRALINLFLDMARQRGFTELYVPLFVKEEIMFGSAQFPKFRDVVYFDPDADVYMLPTAEVAITNLHRGEILEESQLPLYYVAHTPCFRRERMSAGRDVRGIKRVHQFEKVELYKFTSPETSYDELESLAEAASDVCRALKIPFRRLEISTGDLGFSASKKYDVEMWSPGCQEWLEVSSCSNTEAFQARRANVKYRSAESKKTQFVHTLNGSGLATPRVLIAIMENYQQADGSIEIPDVLRPYLGGESVIRKA